MFFKYGQQIFKMVEEYLRVGGSILGFNYSFNMVLNYKRNFNNFPTYEDSHFNLKNNIRLEDSILDLNRQIHFNTIDLLSLQRKDKLEKIQQSVF